jgi:hypothetical protein
LHPDVEAPAGHVLSRIVPAVERVIFQFDGEERHLETMDDARAVWAELVAMGLDADRAVAARVRNAAEGTGSRVVVLTDDEALRVARALDHLRNQAAPGWEDGLEPPLSSTSGGLQLSRTTWELRDFLRRQLRLSGSIVYDLATWVEHPGQFCSFTGRYEVSERVVTATGQAFTVTAVEQPDRDDPGRMRVEPYRPKEQGV